MNFSEAKIKFDEKYGALSHLNRSLAIVDGKFIDNVSIKDVNNRPNEEYYKWQFIYALISAGLFSRDYIGVEIYFPKGNRKSDPIKIDAVIFSEIDWLEQYRKYRKSNDQDALNYLREHAICVIEFKRGDKKIEQVFNSQIKASIKEPDTSFVLGIYYDMGRLYLFKKIDNIISRYDNNKNYMSSQRILEKFQLEITDPYFLIPDLPNLLKLKDRDVQTQLSELKVEDLDIVFTINDENIKLALSQLLKRMDSVSLYDETGYSILIQLFAIKIYDEKQSEIHGSNIRFYVEGDEEIHDNIGDVNVQQFIKRLQYLYAEAKVYYNNLLSENKIEWKNIRHVRLVTEITRQFQRYSFTRSRKSDLYQLVFYNFATEFKKDRNAQFLTPIPIIDFMVDIVNPRRNEKVCDPCCGIADFLSISYINSNSKLDDRNLYGFDKDYNMTLLAQLNMLLNGDGNAVIKYVPDTGSIDHKLTTLGEIRKLNRLYHMAGKWDNWPDDTELMKYDVILTNPPFGKGRSLEMDKKTDREMAEFYELYQLYVQENPKAGFDLGVVFLENAVRLVKEGGRFGIILSNSIASNNSWAFVRDWLFHQVRIVALFDLPQDIFAETGANTTIIVAYKPSKTRLKQLIDDDYAVFVRNIQHIGYIKKTSNRNVVFENDYLLDEETFETVIGTQGESILREDFSKIISEFKEWCTFQEIEIRRLFLE